MSIIKFPKEKRLIPEELKAIESVRANQLVKQFVEVCELPVHEQADGFRGLRVVMYDYYFFGMDKGVQS